MNDSNHKNPMVKKFTFNPSPLTVESDFVKWEEREIPKTIYKYRSWDNKFHQKMISNMEIYFPTPQELNDPFDCQRNFNWKELDDPDKYSDYLKVAAKRIEENTAYSKEERDEIIEHSRYKKYDAKEIEEMEQMTMRNDDFMNSLTGTFTASLIKDSILLWSHYADSHRGFCVGLDTEIILRTIKHGGQAKEAQYEPKIILTSLLDDIVSAIAEKTFSKYEAWGYEFEYRILAGQLPKKKIFPPPEAFKEIIFGINMNERDKEELKYRARKKMPAVKFFQAKKVRNEYKIQIIPI